MVIIGILLAALVMSLVLFLIFLWIADGDALEALQMLAAWWLVMLAIIAIVAAVSWIFYVFGVITVAA